MDGKSESTGCADQGYLEMRGLLDWGWWVVVREEKDFSKWKLKA